MTKVLAFLTVAVLAFSAVTHPAFAQLPRVPPRTQHVQSLGLISPDRPFSNYREPHGASAQLSPFRRPGFLDLGIFGDRRSPGN